MSDRIYCSGCGAYHDVMYQNRPFVSQGERRLHVARLCSNCGRFKDWAKQGRHFDAPLPPPEPKQPPTTGSLFA